MLLLSALIVLTGSIVFEVINLSAVSLIKYFLELNGFNENGPLATIIAANISILGVIITATVAFLGVSVQSKSARKSQIHAESDWRKSIMKLIDNIEWGKPELEIIKNRINLEYLYKDSRDVKSNEQVLDSIIVENLKELIEIAKNTEKKIDYDATKNMRQLLRMKLKNDWSASMSSKLKYIDKESIKSCMACSKNKEII